MDSSIPLLLILQGAALGFIAAASPGAFQTYLINQTLSGGWRCGTPVAFSPFISDPPIVLAVLLLLNQLPSNFISVVSLFGGFFVFFVAWGLWKQWRKGTIGAGTPSITRNKDGSAGQARQCNAWGILARGSLMNLLSPGPYTFWALVLGPILLGALQQSPQHGVAFITGFYTALISGMLGLVLLFDQARRLGQRVVRVLTLASILILIVFGVILIIQGLF